MLPPGCIRCVEVSGIQSGGIQRAAGAGGVHRGIVEIGIEPTARKSVTSRAAASMLACCLVLKGRQTAGDMRRHPGRAPGTTSNGVALARLPPAARTRTAACLLTLPQFSGHPQASSCCSICRTASNRCSVRSLPSPLVASRLIAEEGKKQEPIHDCPNPVCIGSDELLRPRDVHELE